MSSEVILQEKKEIVAEIAGKMKNAAAFVIVDYKGITVEQVTGLRARARAAGVDCKIYKNTFMRFAASECGLDGLDDVLKGPNAILFCEDDPVAPAKIVTDFVKENRLQILELKGGVIEGKVASASEVSHIATLPSRESLIAQIVGSFNAPISKLAYALNAIKEKMDQVS